MDKTDRHRRTGRFLALVGSGLLVAAAVAFAPSASARPSPDSPSSSAPGHHRHAKAGTPHRTTHARGGSSAVSLPRPNGFQAQADPDGMLNGGVDQPGGTGGIDPSSQDGNNGSGNDADCEDDNRGVGVPGHCRTRPAADTPENSAVGTTTTLRATTTDITSVITADSATRTDGVVEAPQADTLTTDQVRGPFAVVPRAAPRVVFAGGRSPGTTVLPNMGAPAALATIALAGMVAVGLGAALWRSGSRRRT